MFLLVWGLPALVLALLASSLPSRMMPLGLIAVAALLIVMHFGREHLPGLFGYYRMVEVPVSYCTEHQAVVERRGKVLGRLGISVGVMAAGVLVAEPGLLGLAAPASHAGSSSLLDALPAFLLGAGLFSGFRVVTAWKEAAGVFGSAVHAGKIWCTNPEYAQAVAELNGGTVSWGSVPL